MQHEGRDPAQTHALAETGAPAETMRAAVLDGPGVRCASRTWCGRSPARARFASEADGVRRLRVQPDAVGGAGMDALPRRGGRAGA